jgi:hypothetical protein
LLGGKKIEIYYFLERQILKSGKNNFVDIFWREIYKIKKIQNFLFSGESILGG